MHGGTTSMVSAGEMHLPGLDYNNFTPELMTSLALLALDGARHDRGGIRQG
ncbi:MAG: hypothetical protein ACKVH1_08420 [Alphaproteobacteria bacterium]